MKLVKNTKKSKKTSWKKKSNSQVLKIAIFAGVFGLVGSYYFYLARAQDLITIDTAAILQTGTAGGARLGINVDYWWDGQANRTSGARSLATAANDMGTKVWRYPGGEKADGYLWSTPPYSSPNPRLARISSQDWPSNDPRYWSPAGSQSGSWSHDIYDFDEFMADCRAANCTPVIVTAYDGIYKSAQSGGDSLTRQEAIDTAAAWVNYAKNKGYNIKYWEIGNETWLPGYMGADPGRSQQARDFVEFCSAMKRNDSNILCGTSADNQPDWETLLAGAASSIDFMSVHSYEAWSYKDYSSYLASNLYPNKKVDYAWNALQKYPADKDRIKLMVTETGGMTFGTNGSWTQADTGHALMTFDMLAQLQQDKRVEFSQFWNTRWVNQNAQNNTWPTNQSEFDALKPDNTLSPQGQAIKLLANYSLTNMISATSSLSAVRSYASHDPATGKLNIWLVNKSTSNSSVTLSLKNYNAPASGKVSVLKGSGTTDINPTFTSLGIVDVNNNLATMTLNPASITLIQFDVASISTQPPAPAPDPDSDPSPDTSPSVGSNNLVLNKAATTSSFAKRYPGASAIDGNVSSRWQTAKKSSLATEWIRVDLGSTATVSRVVLNQGDRWATSYSIKVSQDGTNWTTVASTNSGAKGTVTHTISPISARYISMDSTRWSNSGDRLKVHELEVY